MLDQMTKKC